MGKIILITGATGFTGTNAINYLLKEFSPESGVEIVATDLRVNNEKTMAEWLKHPNFNFEIADLKDRFQLENVVKKHLKPSESKIVVLHIGGLFDYQASLQALFEVNVKGTENLFRVLLSVASRIQRVVIWSGAAVYNFDKIPLPATEESPVEPQNNYAVSKLWEERIAFLLGEHYHIPVTVMRCGAIYGPYSLYGMANSIFLNANGQMTTFTFGDGQGRSALVHAIDTVRAALFLSEKEEAISQIYNVTDDYPYTMSEMAQFLGKRLNNPFYTKLRLPVFVFETAVNLYDSLRRSLGLKGAIDPELAQMLKQDFYVSNAKLKNLGFTFLYPDAKAGIEETIEWYKKEGFIKVWHPNLFVRSLIQLIKIKFKLGIKKFRKEA
jgi:nucleoside-diphosphate-sugar epimerase